MREKYLPLSRWRNYRREQCDNARRAASHCREEEEAGTAAAAAVRKRLRGRGSGWLPRAVAAGRRLASFFGSDSIWRKARAPGRPAVSPSMWRVMPLSLRPRPPCCASWSAIYGTIAASTSARLLAADVVAVEARVPGRHHPGVVVGLAAEHHAVDVLEVRAISSRS